MSLMKPLTFSTNVMDESKIIASISLRPHAQSQQVTLHDVPKGTYAIIVLHDENFNGVLDVNEREFPTEGYAYSNNVGETEVPEFEDASFVHGEETSTQLLNMIYIK